MAKKLRTQGVFRRNDAAAKNDLTMPVPHAEIPSDVFARGQVGPSSSSSSSSSSASSSSLEVSLCMSRACLGKPSFLNRDDSKRSAVFSQVSDVVNLAKWCTTARRVWGVAWWGHARRPSWGGAGSEKRISFAPFYAKTDHFTKTGSGQT